VLTSQAGPGLPGDAALSLVIGALVLCQTGHPDDPLCGSRSMTAVAGTTTGPLMSQLQVFKFPSVGMPFVAADMLVGMGINEESVSTAVADYPLAAFCCVDAEGCLRRVRRQSGDGLDFLSVAAALRDLPRPRRLDPEQPLPWSTPASPARVDLILSSLCPGALLPALPV
jgi:hypothetical protein